MAAECGQKGNTMSAVQLHWQWLDACDLTQHVCLHASCNMCGMQPLIASGHIACGMAALVAYWYGTCQHKQQSA